MTFRLQTRGIRKSFGGVEVLHGVDLDAPAGSVLALLGENGAGKSTLVKILAGDHQPDAGEILVDGTSYPFLDPITARRLGIGMIFQELTDAPALTVAENISLGQWPRRRGVVQWREIRQRATSILDELGVEVDIDAPVSSLRIGERQVVEIARALVRETRCLILDEPTAALSHQEATQLFNFVRRLRERGVALIYITHRLDEVAEIADRVQILRDGNPVLTGVVADLPRRDIVSAMVGRPVEEVHRPEAPVAQEVGPAALRFRDAGSGDAFHGLDLEVHTGEVVALYGKIGSGTGEVAEAAFGLRPLTSGALELDGEATTFSGPHRAISAGMGLLPADRQRQGAFMVRPVAENLSAPSWPRLARFGQFISAHREAAAYRRWHDELGIRSRNEPGQPFATLSGGNQQKVLLGRWLECRSRVLLLIEPTRGVDVGARQEIYRSVRQLAKGGVAVLVATSDHEEVVQLADRAVVMSRGTIVDTFADEAVTSERLATAAGR